MEILQKLLCTGHCEYSASKDIYEINKQLRPLGYEAVLNYDKTMIILKDLEATGYRGFTFDKMIETIDKLLTKKVAGKSIEQLNEINSNAKKMPSNEIIRQLELDGHLKNGVLSENFFIQNDEFLIDRYGFTRCEFCKIICVEGKEHVYCRDLFEKMRGSKKGDDK